MSDEFVKVATKEIQEDVSELEKILLTCDSDDDIISNASKFQKHTHKIKGLAPMMGNSILGDLSASLDSIFKIILNKSSADGVLQILKNIIPKLKFVLSEPNFEIDEINENVSQIEKILN